MSYSKSLLSRRSAEGSVTAFVWAVSGVILAACGGGGSAGVQSSSILRQAQITDGPVANASVYAIEANGERSYVGMSDENGYVSISAEHLGKALKVDVEGAIDRPTGRRLKGEWQSLSYDQYAPGEPIVISPLTDLVKSNGESALNTIFGGAVTLADIINMDNYDMDNASVKAQLITTAAIALTEIKKDSSIGNSGGSQNDTSAEKLEDLFGGYRTKTDKATLNDDDLTGGTLKSAVTGIRDFAEDASNNDGNDTNLAGDLVANVGNGETYTLTPADIAAIDGNTPPANLIFTIASAPTEGTLMNGNTALGVGGTFTQADINAGRITYEHTGSAQDEPEIDNFGFTLHERGDDEYVHGTFSFEIGEFGGQSQSVPNRAPFIISVSNGRIDDGEGQTSASGMIVANDPDDTLPVFRLIGDTGDGIAATRHGFTYGKVTLTGNIWTFAVEGDGLALLREGETETFTFTANASDGLLGDRKDFAVTLVGKNETPPPPQGAPEAVLGLPGVVTLGQNASFLASGFGDHLQFDALDASNAVIAKDTVTLVRSGINYGKNYEKSRTDSWDTAAESEEAAEITYLGLTLKSGVARHEPADVRAADISQVEIVIEIDSSNPRNTDSNVAKIIVYHESKVNEDGRSVSAGDIRLEIVNDIFSPVIYLENGLSLEAVDADSLAKTLPGLGVFDLEIFSRIIGSEQTRPASPVFTLATDADDDNVISVGDTLGVNLAAVSNNQNAQITVEWGHSFGGMSGATPLATGTTFTPQGSGTYHAKFTDTSGGQENVLGHWSVYVAPSSPANPDNSAPVLNGDMTADGVVSTLVYIITPDDMHASDSDNAASEITYTITGTPGTGKIEHAVGNTWETTATFTQDEIDNGDVRYVHLGERTGTDSFDFTVSDGNASPLNGMFRVNIDTSIFSSDPASNVDLGGDLNASLDKGATYTITASDLVGIDDDTPLHLIEYTVSGGPTNGTIRNESTVLDTGDTFTQDDINAGKITYEHDNTNAATDSFSFSVLDYGLGEPVEGTFSLAIDVL